MVMGEDAQVAIQHIVETVVEEVGGGRDAEAALDRLEAGIAAGRVVVVDRRLDANAREQAGTVREGGEGIGHGDPDQG